MMKDGRAMFKSMDTEIMSICMLVDEMLESLRIVAAPGYLHFEIERFRRILLKLRDILDAEASVEWWVIDVLRLGNVKGLIFEDEQLPRSENLEVMTWWKQLRAVLESSKDVLDEISVDISISQKEGLTNYDKQNQLLHAVTEVIERINGSIILKPPDPKRIDARDVNRFHEVVGRQDDVNRLVELLVSGAHCKTTTTSPDVHVIPIVGDSGLGKTTLAKLVYNDYRVENHFDRRMWLSFSNCYVGTWSLIQSSTVGESPPNDIIHIAASDFNLLKSLLHNSLDENKFLLVLDGVPNEICCDWLLLHVALMTGEIGSRILVTTRSSHVSSTLGTVSSHNLQPLPFENCWLLFTDMTSRDDTSSTPPPSQCYQEMVEWFQGFPSLVIALKVFLHSKPSEKEIQVALAKVRREHDSHSHISSALLQTYHSLSSLHVKQCFLYCALLPKDYRFQRHKLVWLWMAEGFLQSKGSMTMEEVGFTYFEELLQAYLFQRKDDDLIHHDSSSYFIPELVQYMLQHICGKEYLRIDNDKPCFSEYTRHLSLCFEGVRGRLSLCCKGVGGHGFDLPLHSRSLHTLLLFGEFDSDDRCRFEEHIVKFSLDLHNI